MKTLKEIKEQIPKLAPEEKEVLETLIGRGQGQQAAFRSQELAIEAGLCRDEDGREYPLETAKRRLRAIINHLIFFHKIPIICQAGYGGGYYIAKDPMEEIKHHRAFHKRGMTGLVKAARVRKSAYVDALAQMAFGFDEDPGVLELRRKAGELDEGGPPAWAALATQLLDRITQDPEVYASELAYVREKYGDIFVPREKVRRLREKVAELQDALKGLAA